MAKNDKGRTHAGNHNTGDHGPVVAPSSAVGNPPVTAPCSKEKPCYTQDAAAEKALPRWRRPEWVIVYVTVVYSFITWLTLRSIKRQANLMDSQAQDARKSAADAASTAQATLEAIKRQVDVLREQNEISRAKGRAKITTDIPLPPEIIPDFPFGKAINITLSAANNGGSTAFNVQAMGAILIEELSEEGGRVITSPDPESWYDLRIPSTIHPTESSGTIQIAIDHIGSPGGDLMHISTLMFDDSRIQEIVESQMSIRVDGRVTYEDIFGEKHTSPFLYVWANRWDEGDETEGRLWRDQAIWLNLSGKST